jgi:hypothetical protein
MRPVPVPPLAPRLVAPQEGQDRSPPVISAGGMYMVAFDVLDATGALAHAATVTLTITLPDGTTATPVITDAAVSGQYRLSYQTTIPGRYTAHAATTGPVTSWDDEFDAAATPWPAMVSLADAKTQLNIPLTDHDSDDLLRDYIAGVTGALEEYKHEVIVRRTVTSRLDLSRLGWYGYASGGLRRQQFWLRSAPVISLTSMVSWDGTFTWDVTQMAVNPSGAVYVMNGPPVTGIVDVAYLAGLAVIPARYKRGALIMLQHLWETQRGQLAALSGVMGPEEHFRQPGEFFTVPDKTKEWMGPPRPVMA